MKILWIKTDFLHPTTRGGQIRTLEMLRRLHARHEVHYVGFEDPSEPEGLARSSEYCAHAYPILHHVPSKQSAAFVLQLAAGVFDSLPLAISRYKSAAMSSEITKLRRDHSFDAVVCDFLASAPNVAELRGCTLFQHNVETAIWRRHHEHAPDPLRKLYFRRQADLMFAYERQVCRAVDNVIAVSESDAGAMRSLFGISNVSAVPTGVDIEYFAPPEPPEVLTDMLFVGSMDWLPNIDGMKWFVDDILPRIRQRLPNCTLTIAGRKPVPEIQALAASDPRIHVTGTVPDIRKYVWSAKLSIVPLRIGGGTRLKIFESMAARLPVISTTVGAEGLDVQSPTNIVLADTEHEFADSCVRLLEDPGERRAMAGRAFELVAARFSWDAVVRRFEEQLITPVAHGPVAHEK